MEAKLGGEEEALGLVESLMSFFQETMVVSPGRSSTVKIWRSPFCANDDDEEEGFLGSIIESD